MYSKKPTQAFFQNTKAKNASDWLKIRNIQAKNSRKQTPNKINNNINNKTKINKQNSKQVNSKQVNSKQVNSKQVKNLKNKQINSKIQNKKTATAKQEIKKPIQKNLNKNIKSNIKELEKSKIINKNKKDEQKKVDIKKQETKKQTIESAVAPKELWRDKPEIKDNKIDKETINNQPKKLIEEPTEEFVKEPVEEITEDLAEELCFNLMGESDPKLITYQKHIQTEVERLWRPPVGIPKGTECSLNFYVNTKGKVENFEIIKKSNILIYDLSILRIAKRFEFDKCLWGKKFTIEFRQ